MSADDRVFGSTNEGFVPRQLADVQKQINDALALIVDPRTGERPFQNATDDTILQQIVAEYAEAVANVENAAAMAFLMRDPNSAIGAGLSSLVQLNGITRNPGAASIVNIRFTGTPGTRIPAGTRVSAADGSVTFATMNEIFIPSGGIVVTGATATTEGPHDPAVGTVVVIQTPMAGLASATNTSTVSVGTDEETDEQLRGRQRLSTNATSYRQIESIQSAVLNVTGVTFCRAYQNRELATDERGIPGKTLACVVEGGSDEDVANAIFFRAPLGIGFFGNSGYTIIDSMGINQTVRFSRPAERLVSVVVNLQIVVDENIQVFPSNGPELITQAILDFAKYGSSVCEPLGNSGFPPGQDIIGSYLYTPINSIGGARVTSILLGVDGGAPEQADIPIAWDELGVFSADRITVNVTAGGTP